MAKSPPTPLQTLYRLTIMGGVLGCVSMAAYRYGPAPEDLAGLIDQAAGAVIELQEKTGVATELADAPPLGEPEPFGLANQDNLAPVAKPTTDPIVDPQVAPASALQPIADTPNSPIVPAAAGLDSLNRQRLVAPLLSAGAVEADVMPWGRSGDLYRAAASAPLGDGTTGAVRRLDAIAETPEQAVAQLRYKMER